MGKTTKRIALAIAVPALVLFIIFVVNQTMLVVTFGERIHPMAGNIILGILLAVYAVCLLIPVYLLITMRSPRTPPKSETDPEYPRFLHDMAKKMSRNRAIGRQVAASRGDIEEALKVLDKSTDDTIKKAASRIFISTAISQNGKLDGIIVLAAQSKLIFDIARIYYQRPTLRNLIHLYANVATMVFLAVEIEDVDLAEVIQPVLTGILGSAAGAIPGLQVASMILVTSVLSGSSNAFLTLRVGAIAKQYCRCLTEPSKRTIRRSATIEATKMLGSIVAEGSKKVYGALWSSSQGKMENIFTGMGERIRNACSAISDRLKPGSTNK